MLELLQSPFVGVHELRKNLTTLLPSLKEGKEIVVTQNGKPVALLMDVERYLELQEALREFADPGYLAALLEARKEIQEGRGVPADDVFAKKGV